MQGSSARAPHPRIHESGLPVSLSLDKPGVCVLCSCRERDSRSPACSSSPADPGCRGSSPRSAGLLSCSGFRALCSALPALPFLPTKQVAAETGRRERLSCPPPQQPGSGGGGQQVQQLLREEGATKCPARGRGIRPSRPHPRKSQRRDPPLYPPLPRSSSVEDQASWSPKIQAPP